VQSVLWYPLGDAILYSTATSLRSLERDMRDGHEVVELASGTLETFWINQDGKILSILGTLEETAGIFSRRLQR